MAPHGFLEADLMATVVIQKNIICSTRDRTVAQVGRRKSLRSLAPKTRQPFICLVNGDAVLRKDWAYRVKRNDLVQFVLLPQGGGGGSNPLRMILMLVVMIFAPYLATAMTGLTAGVGFQLATAAIGLVGSALINALIPPPKPPAVASNNAIAAASPTYSMGAQGNSARLGEVIPVQYGRHLVYPDFAAAPYLEYAGNEQYLYQIFVIGLGEYDIEKVRIEDSDISSFEEIEYEIIQPGAQVTLFPENVYTNEEVSGQELIYGSTIGPFVANIAGTEANYIGIDVVCPRGLYYASDSGALESRSVSFDFQVREIDDAGAPVGGWTTVVSTSFSDSTATPQRRSYKFSVPPGRYEVQGWRTDVKDTSTRAGHELTWSGLRAYLVSNATLADVTRIAMKARATNNLSSQAARKVNVIATRKLRTWHPETGWSAPVPTRSIVWAEVDVVTAAYGGRLPDSRVDLEAQYARDIVLEERNNHFDGRFDSKSTVWEALTQISRCGRSKPYRQGGLVRFVRDEPVELPVGMFSMRNIVKGSFKVDYLMPTEEMADALDMEYFDANIWQWQTVRCALPGSPQSTVITERIFGVTIRQHAWEEGMYMLACNKYRRRLPSLSTEMDGFIPTMGDYCVIAHDMPGWGQSGAVKGWNAGTRTLVLSEPLQWAESGTHYIGLRRPNGSVAGPYEVTEGADTYTLVLEEDPDFTPRPAGRGKEATHYAFGVGQTWRLPVRALSMRPRGLDKVDIEFVVDDPAVHLADTGFAPPPTAYSQLPTIQGRPSVSGLMARSMPDAIERAVLSWRPSAGGLYYLVEQSNTGESWVRCGDTEAPNFTCVALYSNATLFRVAAVGSSGIGPWSTIGYATGAGFMWSANPSTLMWNADDSTLMWS
jgi:hypothetical protein